MNKDKGFTLTELLAVIIIMALLAVAAIGGYTTMTNNGRKKAYESKVASIENAAVKYAKENNLSSSVTFSVNKLVVEGYFQPDENTDSGLAVVINPKNNENMICNLVSVTVLEDVFVAKYDEARKDCDISEQEAYDSAIFAHVYKYDASTNKFDTSKDYVQGDNQTMWVNSDVVLEVGSTTYGSNVLSVSYDFDGNTITKNRNGTNHSPYYDAEDYNRIAIKDVAILFNSPVIITYNLSDGTTHSKSIVVRIDKEKPTGRVSFDNSVTTSSTKKVELYLDDGSGSGLKGFYVSKSEDFMPATYIDSEDTVGSMEPLTGSFEGYKSYFYGDKGTYFIKLKDAAGNENVIKDVALSNFDNGLDSCFISVSPVTGSASWSSGETWFNKAINITATSNNPAGSLGYKYIFKTIGKNDYVNDKIKPKDLSEMVNPNEMLIAHLSLTTEASQVKYVNAMRGLSTASSTISNCSRIIGTDFSSPTVSISCKSDDCDKPKQSHSLSVVVKDSKSGFYDSSNIVKIGWSTSRTSPPTTWYDSAVGTLSKTVSGSDTDKDTLTINTTQNTIDGTNKLTGTYYLWVQAGSIEDKAHNTISNTPSNFSVKFDNTPPDCISTGGGSSWTNSSVTITGNCTDANSGCKKMANSGAYTYDDSGNVKRTYSSEIESYDESPGTVYDKAGNSAECPSDRIVKIDTTKPDCSFTLSGTVGKNDWYRSNVTGTVNYSDNKSEVVQKGIGSYDGRTTFTHTEDTSGATYTCYVKDGAGNENTRSITIKKDTVKPSCSFALSGTKGDNDWYRSNVTGTASFSDALSNVDKKGIGSYNNKTTFTQTSDTSGTTYTCYVKDNAGNENTNSVTIKRDTVKPSCSFTLSGTVGKNGWYRSNVTGTVNYSDNKSEVVQKGIGSYDGRTTFTHTEDTSGATYTCYVKDGAGNENTRSITIKKDTVKPSCSFALSGTKGDNDWYRSNVTGTASFSDALSNVDKKGIGSYNNKTTFTQTSDTSGTTYTCYVKDNAGNENTNSVTIKKDTVKPSCSFTLPSPDGKNDWYRSNVTGTASFSDSLSGRADYGIGGYNSNTTFTHTADTSGTTYTCYVKDNAGNENTNTVTVKKDVVAPTCELGIGRTVGDRWISARGEAPWYGGDANVSIKASGDVCNSTKTDCSRRWHYQVDRSSSSPSENGTWTDTKTVSHTTEGENITYYGHIIDKAGNIGNCQISFNYDPNYPRCFFTLKDSNNKVYRDSGVTIEGNVTVTLHTSDDVYGTINSGAHYYGMKISTDSCSVFDPDSWNHCYHRTSVTHTTNGEVTYIGGVKDYGLNESSCSITFTKK